MFEFKKNKKVLAGTCVTMKLRVLLLFCLCVPIVHLQGPGSGSDGNLRLCIVAERGPLKRAEKFCPLLDEEHSGVECVLGTDQLDCLRRISKGTVDFGVFSPEDLIAAQWANIDILVTNEMRIRKRPYERSIVAVVNRNIVPEQQSSLEGVLRNTTLCHPGVDLFTIRPLSDTLSGYLESLVLPKNCDPNLTLPENRLKALASFFHEACKAGPWVPYPDRDRDLKKKYKSLCAACANPTCGMDDKYWGPIGNLQCLSEGAGDAMWGDLDDVRAYFGINSTSKRNTPSSSSFAYLCKDGSTQPLEQSEPCVWVHRPWPVIIAKRKAAAAVSKLFSSLSESDFFAGHWKEALSFLLELRQVPTPMYPPKAPLDYLASAEGFREAYSQSGCDPPRHITVCTTSMLEKNKCEWLSEAGAVYGINPPLQCYMRSSTQECFNTIKFGESDVTVAGSDWMMEAVRDYDLQPLLYEVTPLTETKMSTVMAYTRKHDSLSNMEDLRGKRAYFPKYDGMAWHAVFYYLKNQEKTSCNDVIVEFFSEICAPGAEKLNVTEFLRDKFSINCYKDGDSVLGGEVAALQALVEGRTDVAFISMETAFMYENNQINAPWTAKNVEITPICPDENEKQCFISWSHLGHIYASKYIKNMRRDEITTVFTRLDQVFGKRNQNSDSLMKYKKRNTIMDAMFRMYGLFNYQPDILFHNNTQMLYTDKILYLHPYNSMANNFELTVNETIDSCQISNLEGNSAFKMAPASLLISSLFLYILSS